MFTFRYLFAVVAGAVVCLVLLALTSDVPAHYWFIRFGVPILFGCLYGLIVAGVYGQASKDDDNMLPGEHVIRNTRYHPVKIVAAAIPAFFSLVLCVVGAYLALADKALTFHGYHPNRHYTGAAGQSYVQQGSVHHIYLWYFPTIPGLVCLVLALWMCENWRCNYLVLTNQRLIQWQYMSPWLPYPIKDRFDAEQNNQIFDIDHDTGTLGKMFGWGRVPLKVIQIRTTQSVEKAKEIELKFVRDYINFANELRRQSPLINQALPGGLPPNPLDTPTQQFPRSQ